MEIMSPLISVVVPHLNQSGFLEACLSSLDAQTLERGRFEVIVVDNGSIEPPAAVVSRHEAARLLEETEPGPGKARNRGVLDAAAPVLAFIDADCRAHPDWLRAALRAIDASKDKTILGGDVQIWKSGNGEMTAIAAYENVFAYRFKLYIEQHGFSGTGNLVVRRVDFDKVGPFAGIRVAEDVDWGRRALAAGYKFKYVREMIVYHPARQSLGELFVKWDRHLQHSVNSSNQTFGWRIRWIARALAVAASPAIDWRQVIFTDRLQGLSPRAKAMSVLIAVRFYRFWRMLVLLNSDTGVVWNRDGRAVYSEVLEKGPEKRERNAADRADLH